MRNLALGILAHVDAGKTTLTESLLFCSGKIAKPGRVDHGDAYLDTDPMEKERGITIFSKQALFSLGDLRITLLDTPGHADFSAEMERVLDVLDYAVLVISASDGVQGHTETLWQLLEEYGIPAFLFVNKMDQPGTERASIMALIREKLSPLAVDFTDSDHPEKAANAEKTKKTAGAGKQDAAHAENAGRGKNAKNETNVKDAKVTGKEAEKKAGDGGSLEELLRTAPAFSEELSEEIALLDEDLMERYLDEGEIPLPEIRKLVSSRHLFPVFFGSALRNDGIESLLAGLFHFTEPPAYPTAFGARVFKITKDPGGQRLTHLKICGGRLKTRDELAPGEKVTQIRLYSGAKFTAIEQAEAGSVCAVTGLFSCKAGDGLGILEDAPGKRLQPVLDYAVWAEGQDNVQLYKKLQELSDEFPELNLRYDNALSEIHLQLMGDVQTEILERLVRERFQISLHFREGKILYRETITGTVEGIGHFEPLRHYAEVHLLITPLARGSGLRFRAHCPGDQLARNWQRLVLQHLREKEHLGVLTGAPVTDLEFCLVAGRAHLKHTEGGDFREATYRAVRQGLQKAESLLLEPFYRFTLEVPKECTGRAMTDLSQRSAAFPPPENKGDFAILRGSAPVSLLRAYPKEVSAYTKGRGRISLSPGGYGPCHNAEEVIRESAYDPDLDLLNPSASVFCTHGSSFLVPFNEVEHYMHLPAILKETQDKDGESADPMQAGNAADWLSARQANAGSYRKAGHYIGDAELEDIFTKTYGAIRNRAQEASAASQRVIRAKDKERRQEAAREAWEQRRERRQEAGRKKKDYLLVDGYNIIFAWEDLKALAEKNLDAARGRLLDILSNYQGFTGKEVIVVFDAYRVQGHREEVIRFHNLYVVFTKEAQTADAYIESLSKKLAGLQERTVSIATSDRVVQIITWSHVDALWSAETFRKEVAYTERHIRADFLETQPRVPNRPFEMLGGTGSHK